MRVMSAWRMGVDSADVTAFTNRAASAVVFAGAASERPP
jgi:hypothetical protein